MKCGAQIGHSQAKNRGACAPCAPPGSAPARPTTTRAYTTAAVAAAATTNIAKYFVSGN